MLIELTDPVGGELSRRWLAALLLVPEDERGAVVSAVERQIAAEYDGRRPDPGAGGEPGRGGEAGPLHPAT